MKKFIPFVLLGALSAAHFGCSSETHYDSISTEIAVDVYKAIETDKTLKLFHRFQFDRDLVPLHSMKLVEAWVDLPVYPDEIQQKDDAGALNFEMIRDISISLVDPNGGASSVFWLYAAPSAASTEPSLFSEMNVGDLRQYMNDEMKLDVEIRMTLDPYQAMRYWRDACKLEDSCRLIVPFSMQFKMED